jgi:hypothetical protein
VQGVFVLHAVSKMFGLSYYYLHFKEILSKSHRLIDFNIRTVELTLYPARFEVLTAVLMKIRIFWDVTPCRRMNS